MLDDIMESLRDNPLPWLMIMFLGVFIWGVRTRAKARSREAEKHGQPPGNDEV